MKNTTPLKKYNNGAILASSPELAAIGNAYMQEVIKENKRRQAIRDAANQQQDNGTYGTWNISDRD